MKDRSRILLEAIGKAIRETRESKGMTQEEVASNVGMTLEEFIDLENGTVKNVTKEDLDTFLSLIGKY